MVEHGRQKIYDKERVQWNTAWLKKGGEHFEVVIHPDEALAFKKSKGANPDIAECIRSEHIFADAKKGQLASEDLLTEIFGSNNPLAVAKTLILDGEIQLSAEHRQQLRDEKRNRILTKINAYAIDPKTGLPHPRKRIELAIEEANIRIDEKKDPEEQVKEIVKKLQPILPIKLETVVMQVHLAGTYGQKLYGDLERQGNMKKTEWLSDGGLLAWVEIPAGLQNEFIDELASKTHGSAEVKKVEENPVGE